MTAKEILTYFNQIANRRFRENKTNLKGIESRLQEGYSIEEIQQVIQLKTLEWKNNPTMAVHLCPETIFRPKNFEKYLNQLIALKENPELLKKYHEQYAVNQSTGNSSAFSKIDEMFRGK